MTLERRPVRSRSNGAVRGVASWISGTSVTPNQISCASVVFAGLAGWALSGAPGWAGYLAAAVLIQLRLLCNVLDGLVAVEGGKKSPTGALYNEFPDRVADSLVIVGAGYGAGLPEVGWLAALLAVTTAYVRVFGGALGFEQEFLGPMAKQHRMAVLSAGCLVGAAESLLTATQYSLKAATVVVAVGSAVTCWTRGRAVARRLRAAGV
ncbi:CDP-alcohol phosphatidyltransferase family protein [Microbispora sp. NPDC004025]